MAAPAGRMAGASGDSSSSEDEALQRCKEAVWDTLAGKTTDGETNGKQSRRVVVSEHEHDGNELQVSQGFRSHVAKKLGHFLDSCISEMQPGTSSRAESTNWDDDEGFRLFSTSVPGQTADDPPPPVRRRPVPSSSDSDSEMESRLREAAVSVRDLLPSSSLPSTVSSASTEPPCSETAQKKKKRKKKHAEEEEREENPVPKKKKKRKLNQEESEQALRKLDSEGSNGENGISEEGSSIQPKVKRKKKKKQEAIGGNSEGEALN
ncbi:protein CUSTOS isoform X2 [Centroberyx affinis]|uniref:protein CUSTOS isoform X2 n=1 Tax=Centroberyx affinis TaxID=166261 RepID=UPI003A5C6083